MSNKTLSVPASRRETLPKLTKFERARILGTRALQISMNAPIFVETCGVDDPLEIARKELLQGVIPLVIRRTLPNGTYEEWTVKELVC